MYRPLNELKGIWNIVNCWNCKHEYEHISHDIISQGIDILDITSLGNKIVKSIKIDKVR